MKDEKNFYRIIAAGVLVGPGSLTLTFQALQLDVAIGIDLLEFHWFPWVLWDKDWLVVSWLSFGFMAEAKPT